MKKRGAFCILLFGSVAFGGFAPPSVNKNNAGVSKYKSEDYTGAVQDFAGALGKDSFKPEYRFNLGQAFAKNGEPDKAIAEFDVLAKDPNTTPELKFKALFNAGNVAVEKKDIPKALQFYQRALEINPDSVETKTNIELALAQGGKGGGDGQDQKDKDGKGEGKNQKEKQENDKDGKEKDKKDEGDKGPPKQGPKPKPRPFKSESLSESEVRQILEELKRQEERIRSQHDKQRSQKNQEQNLEKDW